MDIEQADELVAYLRAEQRIAPQEHPRVRTLAGGVSNRTVLVERGSGESWVLKQALPKLRVSVDWFSDPRRIEREALGLEYLPRLAPPGTITPLIFVDPGHHLLAMRAVPQPHENWKHMLLDGRIDDGHVHQFAALLAAIHRHAAESTAPLRELFEDRSFFESLRLEPYYEYAATQVPPAAAFLRVLVADTRSRRLTLVHGDYSPKNILVHDDRLILLDHEVIHWGDPAFDLGFALAHLLSKAHHLPDLRQRFSDAALLFWREYRAVSGRPIGDLETYAVRHTLGCLLARVAGRSQLEYLTGPEKARQREAVLLLMAHGPSSMEKFIHSFLAGLDSAHGR